MSRYFPTSVYAEDQPLAHTILATHVLHRGFQTGAMVGLVTGTSTYLYELSRSRSQMRSVSTSVSSAPAWKTTVYPTFSQTVFRHAAIGAIAGVAFMSLGLPLMMKDKEEIEWQDRSWRLMHNEAQLSVDNWSFSGASVGLVSSVARRGQMNPSLVVGRAAMGSLVGVAGYMVFRHSIANKNE